MRDKPYGLERFCICLEGVVVYTRPNVEMCLTRGSENGNSGMQLYSAMSARSPRDEARPVTSSARHGAPRPSLRPGTSTPFLQNVEAKCGHRVRRGDG